MKLILAKGTTDVSVLVFVADTSKTDGSGLTGLTYDSADLICYYARPRASAQQVTLATQTVTGAHSDGGFVEIDATHLAGVYRLDLPDAVCATGVDSVLVMLGGAADMAPVPLEIQLADLDLNSNLLELVHARFFGKHEHELGPPITDKFYDMDDDLLMTRTLQAYSDGNGNPARRWAEPV